MTNLQERLNVSGGLDSKVAFQKTEKSAKDRKQAAKMYRLQEHQQFVISRIAANALKHNADDDCRVRHRAARFRDYETVRQFINALIE